MYVVYFCKNKTKRNGHKFLNNLFESLELAIVSQNRAIRPYMEPFVSIPRFCKIDINVIPAICALIPQVVSSLEVF